MKESCHKYSIKSAIEKKGKEDILYLIKIKNLCSSKDMVKCELPDIQAGIRKGRGTRDQIANIRWIIKKPREFQKTIYFCFIDYWSR